MSENVGASTSLNPKGQLYLYLTPVVMKNSVYWYISPCSQLKMNLALLLAVSCSFFLALFFDPEDSPLIFNGRHCIVPEKIELFSLISALLFEVISFSKADQ
jgi:hypothetical protein